MALRELRRPDDDSLVTAAIAIIEGAELREFAPELRERMLSRHPAVRRSARSALERLDFAVEPGPIEMERAVDRRADSFARWLRDVSDRVVVGEIASEPFGMVFEQGVVHYVCDVRILSVVKGEEMREKKEEGPESVDIVRFEQGPEDRLPGLKRGWKCVLFLERASAGERPTWRTTEPFFSAIGYNSSLVAALSAKH